MRSFQNGFVIEPRFSIGDVLSRTFSTLADKPVFFFGLAAMTALPSAVINAGVLGPSSMTLLPVFCNMLLGLMIQGAIAYGVFSSLADQDPSWGEALARGFRRTFYLFLIGLIMGLLVVALSAGFAMFIFVLRSAAILGFLLMLVAGAAMICFWAVTIQACVVEQLGPIASFNRSAELTKGYRWHLFGLLVLIFVVGIVFVVVFSMVATSLFHANWLLMPKVKVVIFFLFSLGSTAFFGTMCSVIYYDLRAVKEGLTLDALADIFD